MKVIIAGSRSLDTDEVAYLMTDFVFKSGFKDDITEVVSGGAKGIDQIGEYWAKTHEIPITQFIPDWNKYGKRAGIIRNRVMAEYADALIAIWDGKSNGTVHMIKEILDRKKPIFVRTIL